MTPRPLRSHAAPCAALRPAAHLPSRAHPGRCRRRSLGPGYSAAPRRLRLALLPSGPDAVHRLPSRGTWPSTLTCASPTSNAAPSRQEFSPAVADCGFREPLAPRLARPGTAMVPAWTTRAWARRTLVSSPLGAHSSAGERPLHTREVPGSIPGAPIGTRRPSGNGLVERVTCARNARNARTMLSPVLSSNLSLTGVEFGLVSTAACQP